MDRAYILATSAGGSAGIKFALNYPDRIKGLILLSSGAPDKKRSESEIGEIGMTGPPQFILKDFTIWLSLRYFKFIFNNMFGSKIKNESIKETLLPVKERRAEIIADSEITNKDMTLNYEKYPLEDIKYPILVIHAKDDPMASYDNIKLLSNRIKVESVIYDEGGHLLEGHDVYSKIKEFIEK